MWWEAVMTKFSETKVGNKTTLIWNNKFFGVFWIRLGFLSIILNLIIEIFSRHSLMETLNYVTISPVIFFYNSLIIYFTLTFAGMVKKRTFFTVFIGALWVFLGVVNYVITSYRKTPFTAPDILNVIEAYRILPKYFSLIQIILLLVLALSIVAIMVIIAFKSPKYTKKINYLKTSLISVTAFAMVMLSTQIGTGTGMLATNFGNIIQAYDEYGFEYCFLNSVFNSGIDKPEEYSKDVVEDLVDEVETSVPAALDDSAEIDPETDDYPNIIFVQLESLFDPELVIGVEYSQDPIPNLRELYKNYSSGYLSVPSFGAGTANTEFEVITGMNLDDFGPGEYPYKTVLRADPCESICYYLKDYGYSTNALHDNEGNFYGRNTVFSKLGFDTFTSIEYINDYETNPTGWAEDECLTDEILGILDSTAEQDFIYTISVQGHGDYPEDISEMDLQIKVTNNDVTGNPDGYEYYINQIYEMDQFVGDLLEEIQKRDEKTVVVFYGDHLPTFDFTDEKLENGDIYQTEYVIWNNFGIDKEDEDIQAFQLSSIVMSRLGLVGGVISKYHLTSMNQEDQEAYLEKLTLLEYDILYGDCDAYDGVLPYTITNMQMGYQRITIENAVNYHEDAWVLGENFTESSKVRINGDEVDVTFVNKDKLILEDYQLENKDQIVVVQETSEGDELSSTSIYIYKE